MKAPNNKWIRVGGLLLLLVGVSLFKDQFTPDYRNTPAASFLDPAQVNGSRLCTLLTHPWFWTKSLLYSGCFIILPPLIIRSAIGNPSLSRFTLWLHLGLVAALYLAVLMNRPVIDVVFVSKLNRYLHSPIITLFLWAAFTITLKRQPDE